MAHCSRRKCWGRSEADQLTVNESGVSCASSVEPRTILTDGSSTEARSGEHVQAAILGSHQALRLVELLESLLWRTDHLVRLQVDALLDHQGRPPLLCHLRSDNSSSCARADDEDVRLEKLVVPSDAFELELVVLTVARGVGKAERISFGGKSDAGEHLGKVGVNFVHGDG